MKSKWLSLVLSFLLAAGVCIACACAEQEEETPPVTETPPVVETVPAYGQFMPVSEAYHENYLSKATLKIINENIKNNVNITPLSETRREKILHDYNQTHAVKSDQLEIEHFGCYGECTLLRITDKYYYNHLEYAPYGWYCIYTTGKRHELEVALSKEFWSIQVWIEFPELYKVEKPQKPNGAFFTLNKAYEHGFLNKEDLTGDYLHKAMHDGFPEPSDWQTTAEKIKQDYLLLDIDTSDRVKIDYCGELNGCFVVRMWAEMYQDPWQYSVYHKIDGVTLVDLYRECTIWKPLD